MMTLSDCHLPCKRSVRSDGSPLSWSINVLTWLPMVCQGAGPTKAPTRVYTKIATNGRRGTFIVSERLLRFLQHSMLCRWRPSGPPLVCILSRGDPICFGIISFNPQSLAALRIAPSGRRYHLDIIMNCDVHVLRITTYYVLA